MWRTSPLHEPSAGAGAECSAPPCGRCIRQPSRRPGLAAAFLSLRRLDLSRLDPFSHDSGLTGLAAGELALDLEGATANLLRLLPALVCQDFEARPQDDSAWPHLRLD